MPGVYKVNQLMLTGSRQPSHEEVQKKVEMITRYAKKAQSEISRSADEVWMPGVWLTRNITLI